MCMTKMSLWYYKKEQNALKQKKLIRSLLCGKDQKSKKLV